MVQKSEKNIIYLAETSTKKIKKFFKPAIKSLTLKRDILI